MTLTDPKGVPAGWSGIPYRENFNGNNPIPIPILRIDPDPTLPKRKQSLLQNFVLLSR